MHKFIQHIMDASDGSSTCKHVAKSYIKSHKLLKMAIPNQLFYDFIRKIAHKNPNSNHYLIDITAYKKSTYCEEGKDPSILQQFCTDLMPHYCNDKQFFLTRKMSYNNLNTILRQVCRHNAIEFNTTRKYDKSKTQIVYHVGCECEEA